MQKNKFSVKLFDDFACYYLDADRNEMYRSFNKCLTSSTCLKCEEYTTDRIFHSLLVSRWANTEWKHSMNVEFYVYLLSIYNSKNSLTVLFPLINKNYIFV